ncbi:YkvI family membrane protein [Sulfobacillus thermosulfidooxidans]|uniref:YkvI family membrane protein n=1 Tax=Sulfobacillus thermosulfidooxidans TaxID=28034 RepID=UPI0006B40320|nr:hypothetical protein [Sulfobacillus thermosulfidooxidans]
MRLAVILSVALAYVGTVVGAGFASGQEIWQFFSRFGSPGMMGIIISSGVFSIVGAIALEKGRQGITDFGHLLSNVYSPNMARMGEGMTDVFLLLGLIVVIAGGGSTLSNFHVNPWIGKIFTLAIILYVGYWGVDGITKANGVIVPYLILITLLTSVLSPLPSSLALDAREPGAWLLSAVLYVSYNLFTAVMVLLGLGSKLHSSREAWYAATLGGVILGLLLTLEHHVLVGLSHVNDLPMLTVAYRINTHLGIFYALSLWLALLTTGIGIVFVLRERYGKRYLVGLWIVLAFTQWSFQALVKNLYPVMGSLAIMLWLPLFVSSRGADNRH